MKSEKGIRAMFRWFSMFLLLIVGACSTGPRINADFDPAADFSRYKSYAWVRSAPSGGANPLIEQRVRDAIDATLAQRGFTKVATNPDFAVDVTLGARDRVETTDFGAYRPFYPGYGFRDAWGWRAPYSTQEVRSFTEGTLAIDIYDASTRRPVWHGKARKDITPGRIVPTDIDEAVAGILARFPPSAAP